MDKRVESARSQNTATNSHDCDGELVIALSMRSLKYSVFKVGPFKNKYLWYAIASSLALQLVILYVPGLQSVFDVHMPELVDWAVAALFGAIVFATIEIGKYITSRRRSKA